MTFVYQKFDASFRYIELDKEVELDNMRNGDLPGWHSWKDISFCSLYNKYYKEISISFPEPSNSSDWELFSFTGFLHLSSAPKQTIWSSIIDKVFVPRMSSPSLTVILYFPLKTRVVDDVSEVKVSFVHHSLKIKSRYFLPAALSWKL